MYDTGVFDRGLYTSMNFFVFLKSHDFFFENPEYDWKDFVHNLSY